MSSVVTLRRFATWWATAALLAACAGPQHMMVPGGPDAKEVVRLWWVLFLLAAGVCVLVTLLLARAVMVSRRRHEPGDGEEVDSRLLVIGGGVVLPVIILIPVLVYSFGVGERTFPREGAEDGMLTVEVIGHQFWWEVRYPGLGISTANEIRIPAGEPVRFRLFAPDVIHSFWVPQLHGKIDMIPGRASIHVLEADEVGWYRGQCAEFCGLGHALMAFWVEAVTPEEFSDWTASRGAVGSEPAAANIVAGREIFFSAGCGGCHATRGAPLPEVLGTPGPDLTDLASRRTLGAARLPNDRANLEAWIADPVGLKPGARMPPTPLPPAQMAALLDYLETLR